MEYSGIKWDFGRDLGPLQEAIIHFPEGDKTITAFSGDTVKTVQDAIDEYRLTHPE